MAGFQVLPSDIIFEILSRTTWTTLDTCRCVCKGWRQLSHETDFMPTYYKRSKNVDGFFVHGFNLNTLESRFITTSQGPSVVSLARGIEILAAAPSHGLLFCQWQEADKRLFVGKPTTHQWQALPSPNYRWPIAAAGMVVVQSSPLRYQIVKLSSQDKHAAADTLTVVELFDSKSWTWCLIQTINLGRSLHWLPRRPCVFVHGFFYWMTNFNYILAYHVGRQSFHEFPLSNPLQQSVRHCNWKFLVEYQGELGLCCSTLLHDYVELWVMENTQGNWREEIVIDLQNLNESVRLPVAWGFCKAEIVLLRASEEVVFYNFREGNIMSRFKLDEPLIHAVKFRSDFERVHLEEGVATCSSPHGD